MGLQLHLSKFNAQLNLVRDPFRLAFRHVTSCTGRQQRTQSRSVERWVDRIAAELAEALWQLGAPHTGVCQQRESILMA